MTLSYADLSDQLSDQLRDIEHKSHNPDELFHCAYLLGLLGVVGGEAKEGADEFATQFDQLLKHSLESEKVPASDQEAILFLWKKIEP